MFEDFPLNVRVLGTPYLSNTATMHINHGKKINMCQKPSPEVWYLLTITIREVIKFRIYHKGSLVIKWKCWSNSQKDSNTTVSLKNAFSQWQW